MSSSSDDEREDMRYPTKTKKISPDIESQIRPELASLMWINANKVSPNPDNLSTGNTESTCRGIGRIGIKCKLRIIRIYDSEEHWKGSVEIYFHWTVNKNINPNDMPEKSGPRRRQSVSILSSKTEDMEIIEEPTVHPIFLLLNDESSHLTEEMYYKCNSYPNQLFGYVSYTVRVHERLELERYPFDRQFFKLEIECSNGDVVPWYHKNVSSLIRTRLSESASTHHFFGVCDSPSWQLDVIMVKRGERLSTATICLGLSRLSGFYISNVVIPVFLIGTGGMLTAGIDSSAYGDRFQCMISLFLTLVAIKFVASFLPVISYSTLLDYYNLMSYLFLAVWMLENFLVSPLFIGEESREWVRKWDAIAAIIYLVLWVLVHIAIVLGSYYDLFRKSWADVQEDDGEIDPNSHKESSQFHE
jgi:hypothetical protein